MRLQAWSGRPPLKPPPSIASSSSAAADHVGSSSATLVAPTPSTSSMFPPAARSRPSSSTPSFFTRVCRLLGITPGSKEAPARAHQPTRVLDRVLHSLPPISLASQPVRLRHRPREDIHQELYQWKRACAIAYVALDGPLRPLQAKYRSRVTRVVAHTLRLLVRTQQYEVAAELDRAFFTSSPDVRMPFPLSLELRKSERAILRNASPDSNSANPDSSKTWPLTSSVGLGFYRGNTHLAWMQSLALRLEPSAFDSLDGFGQLLALLHDEQGHTEQGIDPHIVAFLVRKAPKLERRLRELGASEEDARAEMSRMMTEIRGRPEFEDQLVVRLAVAETALGRLETGLWDQEIFEQVDEDVRRFVSDTDGSFVDEIELLEELAPSADANAGVPDPQLIEFVHQRAQVLSLAIRFVIHRARIVHDHHDSGAKMRHRERMQFRQSIATAAQLYEELLHLLPVVSRSPKDLFALRERQSGALYRILWASVGTFDLDARMVTIDDHPSLGTNLPTSFDPHTLQQALHILSLTRLALVEVPIRVPKSATAVKASMTPSADPLLIGVSSQFWRRLLHVLCLPASPSRRTPPHPAATRPPWIVLKRSLQAILATRQYDLSRRPKKVDTFPARELQGRSIRLGEVRLFERISFARHLTRAVVLGGSDPSRPDEESIVDRVGFFLTWVDEWCGTLGNEVRRSIVKDAMMQVVVTEFEGEVGAPIRRRISGMIAEWYEVRGSACGQ